jgi:hypothetical protein
MIIRDATVGLRLSEETKVSDAQSAEARPVSNTLTSPLEAQRRLRTFGEDYLNKELDLFLSILPDKVVGKIISALTSVELAQDWNIIGNSNDLEDSTGMKFMQVDTLAYSDRLVHLVAIEQKIDAKPMDDQALKYAAAAAFFEVHDFIPKGTRFSLLFVMPDEISKRHLESMRLRNMQLIEGGWFKERRKRITPESLAALELPTRRILETCSIECVSWQEVGDCLGRQRIYAVENDLATKLITGFLYTLSQKRTRDGRKIYVDHESER